MNKNSLNSNYSKSRKFFKTKIQDKQEDIKINQNFNFAKLELTMIKISDFIITFFYITSFLQFYMFGIAKKEKSFNLNSFFHITIIFFFLNIMVLFAYRIIFFKFVKKKSWQSVTVELIIKILSHLRYFFLTVYLLTISIYLTVNMKYSINNSYEINTEIPYEKSIYFLLNKYYQINLISTILYVLSNNQENMKITILQIFLMLIPNFFSIIYMNLYWDEITNLIYSIFILFFIFLIRETVFEFFLKSKGYYNDIERKVDSVTKLNNNEAIKAENPREKFKINFNNFENSNKFYFEVWNNKINLICEDLKFFIFENIYKYSNKTNNKYEDLIRIKNLKINNFEDSRLQEYHENQDIKKLDYKANNNYDASLINEIDYKTNNNYDASLINEIELEENLNLYLKGLKLYKIYKKELKEEEIKNFLFSGNKNFQGNKEFEKDFIDRAYKTSNKENTLTNKQIVSMEDIKFSIKKDFNEILFFNKGNSIFTFINNLNDSNNKKVNSERNIIDTNNLRRNKPINSKLNIQENTKRFKNKIVNDSNSQVNNSSCQNIITLENKNILHELKDTKKLNEKTTNNQMSKEIQRNFNNNKIEEKYEEKESSYIVKSIAESEGDIKNTDKIIVSNFETAFYKPREVKESINEEMRNAFKETKCIINIGIYKLNLSEIFDSKDNSSPMNKSILNDDNPHNLHKESFNIFYFDISVILSFMDCGSLRIELCMKNVSEYFQSYEKLKRKFISNSLKISKLIHEFKTPINCIIGLSSEIQILTEEEFNSTSFKNLREDIERIQHLSNYSVFLIKDFMSFLSKPHKKKKNEQIKNLSNSNSNIEEKQILMNDQRRSTVRRNAKRQKIISTNKLSELQNCPLNEILNFGFSILTSLIKCSKSKKENIQPLLTTEEEMNFIYLSTDDIKFKQILLNLISNSVKFTNSGFIEIEAKYEENDLNSNKNLEIIVKDSGIGIKKHEQHKLFQDYANIKIDINNKIDNKFGTGLGLSLSKQIAKQLGIELIYDSYYNEGTKFLIRIPFEKYQISQDIMIIDRNESKFINIKNTSYDSYNMKDSSSTIKNVTNLSNIGSNYQLKKQDKLNKNCNNINNTNYKINDDNNNNYNNEIITSIHSKTDRKNIFNKSNTSLRNKKTNDSSDSQRNTLNNPKLNTNVNSKSNEQSMKEDTSIKQYVNSNNIYNNSNKITKTYSSKIIISPYLNGKFRDGGKLKKSNFEYSINSSFYSQISSSDDDLSRSGKDSNIKSESFNGEISNMNSSKNIINLNTNKKNKHNNLIPTIKNENKNSSKNLPIVCSKKQKHKILIVDDNEILLRTLHKMLLNLIEKNNEEYEIITASDGLDILRYIIEDQFKGNLIKCIITDENMEFINGSEAIEILSKLRRRNKIKNISVIFSSSFEDYDKFSQFCEDLSCEFLAKPITINKLDIKMKEIEIFNKG